MIIQQAIWRRGGWDKIPEVNTSVQLVLVFCSTEIAEGPRGVFDDLEKFFPNAFVFGCTTAGEIYGNSVIDDSLTATAIKFEHTELMFKKEELSGQDSRATGRILGNGFSRAGLAHVLVLSDGLNVNGSELAAGIAETLPAGVAVTGGLSGDGERMANTRVIWNGAPFAKIVGAVGLYGDRLNVGIGSLGGWDPFGPERLITKSAGNVLYELDGRSALDLYKQYLGDHVAGLPSSALLFPLSLRIGNNQGVVRTILGVDEVTQSMTFAGDMPEGAYARLMKANFERLIDGASQAARQSARESGLAHPDLALLISCVGRKLVLQQRVEEEVEAVQEVVGDQAVLTGFYSYGEISPFSKGGSSCELHNQTMTITTFSEARD